MGMWLTMGCTCTSNGLPNNSATGLKYTYMYMRTCFSVLNGFVFTYIRITAKVPSGSGILFEPVTDFVLLALVCQYRHTGTVYTSGNLICV